MTTDGHGQPLASNDKKVLAQKHQHAQRPGPHGVQVIEEQDPTMLCGCCMSLSSHPTFNKGFNELADVIHVTAFCLEKT